MNTTPPIDAEQALTRLIRETRPLIHAAPDSLMIGIRTGGVWIAERLRDALAVSTPPGELNISFYRDDFSRIGLHPGVGPSRIETDLDGRSVILVDDVLHTGRTVRAALNELFDFGRPAAIRLAVLVDRGARELPLMPDATGARIDLDTAAHVKLAGPEPLTLELQP